MATGRKVGAADAGMQFVLTNPWCCGIQQRPECLVGEVGGARDPVDFLIAFPGADGFQQVRRNDQLGIGKFFAKALVLVGGQTLAEDGRCAGEPDAAGLPSPLLDPLRHG